MTDETENTDSNNDDNTDDTTPAARPLGFWLRTVDAYIARELADAFASEGVSRRDWMLLNAAAGDLKLPGFAERLARKGKRMRGLEQRGWVEEAGDGTWVLTDEGRAAKERLDAAVDGIRSRVAGAVSPEDFATTVASLEAIARELGWDDDARVPWMGFGRQFGPGFGRGFGPGFGPRAFGPEMHQGFGPGMHRGFRPGFGPGGMPSDAEGFGHHHPHHDHHDHGDWHGHCGHGHGHHDHGHHDHGHHGQHGDGSDAQSAYERGFDAGFTRGQAAS